MAYINFVKYEHKIIHNYYYEARFWHSAFLGNLNVRGSTYGPHAESAAIIRSGFLPKSRLRGPGELNGINEKLFLDHFT